MSLTPLNVDLGMVTACQICRGRAQQRNNGPCQQFSLGESCFSSSHPDANSFLSICPWCLLSYCPSTGPQSKQVWVSLCTGPLRGMRGNLVALHLTQPWSPRVYTSRCYGDFSAWHRNSGLGVLLWSQDHSFHFASLLLLPVCMWFFLYMISYRTSVQLESGTSEWWLFCC